MGRRRPTAAIAVTLVMFGLAFITVAWGAMEVPRETQKPGMQPRQVGDLELPDKCDIRNGGYNRAVEPRSTGAEA